MISLNNLVNIVNLNTHLGKVENIGKFDCWWLPMMTSGEGGENMKTKNVRNSKFHLGNAIYDHL